MKNVLIIGATGGIGYEILKKLYANEEYRIFATTTNEKNTLTQDFPKIEVFVFDHMSRKEDELIKAISDKCGKLDGIIIASGVTSDSLCMRLSDELWDKTLEVNLGSPFRVLKHAFRKLNNNARVILISSVVARMGNVGQVAYAASKGGLEAMTKTLAREFSSKQITVNAVAPGFIRTKMTQDFDEEVFAKNIPLGRFGLPEEVADGVLYLLNAAYVTGHTLEINGGMWMV